jgi:hypothetical protein
MKAAVVREEEGMYEDVGVGRKNENRGSERRNERWGELRRTE